MSEEEQMFCTKSNHNINGPKRVSFWLVFFYVLLTCFIVGSIIHFYNRYQ